VIHFVVFPNFALQLADKPGFLGTETHYQDFPAGPTNDLK
jgi:hypothetical protein